MISFIGVLWVGVEIDHPLEPVELEDERGRELHVAILEELLVDVHPRGRFAPGLAGRVQEEGAGQAMDRGGILQVRRGFAARRIPRRPPRPRPPLRPSPAPNWPATGRKLDGAPVSAPALSHCLRIAGGH